MLVDLQRLGPGGIGGAHGEDVVLVGAGDHIQFGFRRKVARREAAEFMHDFDSFQGGLEAVFAGGLGNEFLDGVPHG